jgi:hypothetical protein
MQTDLWNAVRALLKALAVDPSLQFRELPNMVSLNRLKVPGAPSIGAGGLSVPSGGAAIVLLPATTPSPTNVGTTSGIVVDTGSQRHYVQALAAIVGAPTYDQQSRLMVRWTDANNFIYLSLGAGDANNHYTITQRIAGVETQVYNYQALGVTEANTDTIKLEDTDAGVNLYVNASVRAGPFSIPGVPKGTSAGINTGSGPARSTVVGATSTPLSITSTTLNPDRTLTMVITYVGTPDTYEYRINSTGAWASVVIAANPSAGNATLTIPAVSSALNGTSPAINLRQKNLTSVTANGTVYVASPQALGMNLSYPSLGQNERNLRNLVLYGDWQDAGNGFAVLNNSNSPTKINRNFMPIAMPTGSWFHYLMFGNVSGARYRLRCNSLTPTFSLDSSTATGQTPGSDATYKWIDYTHTYDPTVSADSAYVALTISALGASVPTLWEAYEIDGSGNPLETGYFDQGYLNKQTKFDCLRFMDLMGTNGNNTVTMDWTDRMSTNELKNREGFPIDRLISLWTASGKDAWFCIPWKATNTYIDSLCALLLANVPTGRKVYIELANEVWNSSFPVWTLAVAEGKAAPVTTPSGGVPTTDNDYALARFSQRYSEVMARVTTAFAGNAAKVVRVCGVARNAGNFDYVANNYSCDTYVDAYAHQLYFGFNANNDPTLTADPTVVFSRYSTGTSVSIDQIMPSLTAMKAKTNGKGKRLIIYEGGVEKMTGSSATLQRSVNRDARMYNKMIGYYQQHATLAGDLLNVFEDVKRITDFGGYGQQEYFNQPRANAPKLDAMLTTMGL